jgi:hypothetical protein
MNLSIVRDCLSLSFRLIFLSLERVHLAGGEGVSPPMRAESANDAEAQKARADEGQVASRNHPDPPPLPLVLSPASLPARKSYFLTDIEWYARLRPLWKKSVRTNFSEGCLIKAGWVFTGPTLSRGTQTVTKPTKSARRHSLERDSARIRVWGQQSAIAFVWEELNHVRADYYLYELPDGHSAN